MKDDLELQLRALLAREEPPPGFAARTLARVNTTTAAPRRPWKMPFAIAAAVLVSFGAAGVHRIREQQRAETAKEQLMLALKITSEKLAVVEKALDRSTN